MPAQLRDEIAHFFTIYRQPQGVEVEVRGWAGTDEALQVLDDARRRATDGERPR